MNPKLIEQMGNAMGDVYAAVVNEILVNMAKHFPYIDDSDTAFSVWQYQTTKLGEMGQIRRETLDILVNMLGGADAVLRSYLQNAIMDGIRDADKPIQDAAKAGLLPSGWRIPPEVSPEQTQAFKAFYRQSADKLNLVNTVMLESTEQAYQSTVSDIVSRIQRTQTILNTQTGKVVTGVTALNQAMRDGVKQMVQNGITGFIDHAGHRWTPEAYVTMDIRTTLANTARAAVFERSEETGNDLYQVSYHDGARPLCYPWQGKVISRQDLSREVTDRDGNTVHVYAQSETTYGEAAGLFGINCGHYPIPFVPGFSKIRPPEQDAEENAKEYEESQQQRALERNLRNEKRDLAVLRAQNATKEEIAAQRERVRAASAKLDAFSDETGRARRKGREGVPIQATFPDKDTYDPGTFRKTQRDKMREFFRNGGDEPPPRPMPIHIPPPPEPPVAKVPVRPANEQEILKQFIPVMPDRIEYGELFKPEAKQITEQTHRKITTMYRIGEKLGFVGDVRISRGIPQNVDVFDLHEDYRQIVPAEAQYIPSKNKIDSLGRAIIEIHNEDISTDYSLQQMLRDFDDIRLRKGSQDLIKSPLFLTSSGLEGTLTHEYGHFVADYYGVFGNESTQEAKAFRDWMVDYWKTNNDNVKQISGYAASNPYEMFAEAFTLSFLEGGSDSVAYKTAMEIMTKFHEYIGFDPGR